MQKIRAYHLNPKHYDKRILHFPFFDNIEGLIKLLKQK